MELIPFLNKMQHDMLRKMCDRSVVMDVEAGGRLVRAYVVAQTEVFDVDGYQPYADGFWKIFSRHGGEFISSSQSETIVSEGVWDPPNTVIMVFPDRTAAEAWLSDPEYVELAQFRHRSARTNMVIVDTASDQYLVDSRARRARDRDES